MRKVVSLGTVFAIVSLSGLLLLAGCGRGPREVYEYPQTPSGYWEKAWVEPQIVLADSVYTLIRALRVDSFWVSLDGPSAAPAWIPAVEFSVDRDSCFAVVNLYRTSDVRVPAVPLVARFLPYGFYKLSMVSGVSLGSIESGESYLIKAVACNRETIVPVLK